MQFTRTIASIVALSMALCALPTRAESEDTPLPGDFQLAPAARPPKAKPLNLPPVNTAANSEKASEPPTKANRGNKHRQAEAGKTVRKPASRATRHTPAARQHAKAVQAPALTRNSKKHAQPQPAKRTKAKTAQISRSKKATAKTAQRTPATPKPALLRHSAKRKNLATNAAHNKKAVKKAKPVKKPAHHVAKTKK